jgi:hypothetical protein
LWFKFEQLLQKQEEIRYDAGKTSPAIGVLEVGASLQKSGSAIRPLEIFPVKKASSGD